MSQAGMPVFAAFVTVPKHRDIERRDQRQGTLTTLALLASHGSQYLMLSLRVCTSLPIRSTAVRLSRGILKCPGKVDVIAQDVLRAGCPSIEEHLSQNRHLHSDT